MKTKTTFIMVLATSLMLNHLHVNAQNWLITGNANATAASKLGTTNNIPLRLFTNNAEQVHINANVAGKVGFVGLGTTAPNTRLHVNGVITATGGTSTNWNLAFTRVPAGSNNKVPRWNGTGYIAGSITDNASLVGIGGGVLAGFRLNVAATASLSGINIADPVDGYAFYSNKSGNGLGIYVLKTSTSTVTGAITGQSSGSGNGLEGYANTGIGTYSTSNTGYGMYAYSGSNHGIYASSGSSTGYAGYFISPNYRGIYVESNSGFYAGFFAGMVYTTESYVGSDAKLKKNITEVNNAMGIINQLQPKYYEFRNDGNFAKLNLPQGKHYGLLAQDVEKVLPNLVKEAGTTVTDQKPKTGPSVEGQPVEKITEERMDFKAVNYTELIPIIIKAMQEQQKEITDLKAENQQMKQDMLNCCLNHTTGSANDKLRQSIGDQPSLEQNAPNPFTEQTLIRYYLPAGSTAILRVMALDGKEMYSTPITKTGTGAITISANTLSAGTYTYALVVNGKAVESRIMILSE